MGILLFLQGLPACPVDGYVTSEFGYRRDPITHRRRWHRGLDIGATEGEPIRSVWRGKVTRVSRSVRGYGNSVIVQSGDKNLRYAHMLDVAVAAGDVIEKGDVIGSVGQTGRATGPHLHLEVWERGRPRDPEPYTGLCLATAVRNVWASVPPTTEDEATATLRMAEPLPR